MSDSPLKMKNSKIQKFYPFRINAFRMLLLGIYSCLVLFDLLKLNSPYGFLPSDNHSLIFPSQISISLFKIYLENFKHLIKPYADPFVSN